MLGQFQGAIAKNWTLAGRVNRELGHRQEYEGVSYGTASLIKGITVN